MHRDQLCDVFCLWQDKRKKVWTMSQHIRRPPKLRKKISFGSWRKMCHLNLTQRNLGNHGLNPSVKRWYMLFQCCFANERLSLNYILILIWTKDTWIHVFFFGVMLGHSLGCFFVDFNSYPEEGFIGINIEKYYQKILAWWFKSWPFWDEFTWPVARTPRKVKLSDQPNVWGMKKPTAAESPGGWRLFIAKVAQVAKSAPRWDRRLCSWQQAKCLGQLPRPIPPQSSLEFQGDWGCGKKCQLRWPYQWSMVHLPTWRVWYLWWRYKCTLHGSYACQICWKFMSLIKAYWSRVENGWVSSENCFKFGCFLIRFPPQKKLNSEQASEKNLDGNAQPSMLGVISYNQYS